MYTGYDYFVLFFGENPQGVAYSAQPLCWSGRETPPPPLTGGQYRKMEQKYPEGGHCQSVLRPEGVEKLISGKVSTSSWDRTCDPWHQVPGA